MMRNLLIWFVLICCPLWMVSCGKKDDSPSTTGEPVTYPTLDCVPPSATCSPLENNGVFGIWDLGTVDLKKNLTIEQSLAMRAQTFFVIQSNLIGVTNRLLRDATVVCEVLASTSKFKVGTESIEILESADKNAVNGAYNCSSAINKSIFKYSLIDADTVKFETSGQAMNGKRVKI